MRTRITTLSFAAATMFLAGCGYDGSYRYPCQDPTNWETPDCQPPICEASGTCTKDLLPPTALTP